MSELWQLPDPDSCAEHIRWIYDYWVELAEDGLPPQRKGMDPITIAGRNRDILPHIWLLDVENDPRRFRYRLVGGVIQEAGGVAKAGDYVDDFDSAEVLMPLFSQIADTKVPHYHKLVPVMDHSRYVNEVEVLFLPLCDGPDDVVMLLNCTVYHWKEGYDERWVNMR